MAKSAEQGHPNQAFGWAATDTFGVLTPFKFSRRATGEKDVRFKVLFCGICHSDLHMIKNEWGKSRYPIVPGHEVVGIVTEVGSKVEKLKVGDKVGVGCFVGACHSCDDCANDLENYCPKKIYTYGDTYYDGTATQGGYSDVMVAEERYVIHFPDNLPLDGGAPLLWGLGHVAVKFAKAFGVKVTVISTSPGKKEEALERLGADSFVVSRDPDQMRAAMGTMDGIIDTVFAAHPLLPLIGLLKSHGKLILVAAPIDRPIELPVYALMSGKHINPQTPNLFYDQEWEYK
ncbi:putative mannitol dehydrogenase [Vitis vinifera]|uniref:Putative mannitol dehydrogenase n=1 Tax=Vitis vinifera TaxID=29760 RepID=A0A438FBH0_VITVI|nr:putative mannitol dehydrogenase [Vitis vinifera]